jgi:magnesium transporter
MIVDCAAYEAGVRRTGRLDIRELPAWLGRPGTFVWIGLRMPNADELRATLAALGATDIDIDETLAAHARPVLSIEGDHIHLVLRSAHYNDPLELVTLGEVTVLACPAWVVTIRFGQASPLDRVRRELEADPSALQIGVPAVVARVIDRIVDDYGPALDGFEHDVVEAERDVFDEHSRDPTRRLYALKRQVRELLVTLSGLDDPLHRLIRTQTSSWCAPAVHDLQESADQLARVVQRASTLSDLLTSALDANLTQVSLRQNDDMRRISAWIAIAAIPTMVAGIYGMNFEHLPELEWRYGYPLILGLMAVACGLLYRRFRRSGWL